MKRIATPALIFVGGLGIWEAVVRILTIPQYLLPSPFLVIERLYSARVALAEHALTTGTESLAGLVIGAVFGFTIATAFTFSRTLERGLYPYVIAFKSMPIVAIAPLLIVWMGNGMAPKIAVAAIIAFFPVVVNVTRGMRSVDNEALDLFHAFAASRVALFAKLQLPVSIPYFFAALRIAATLAVIGAVVGEFAGADKGLGFYILISSYRLDTVGMFAGIVLTSGLGILLFYLVGFLERYLAPWARAVSTDEY